MICEEKICLKISEIFAYLQISIWYVSELKNCPTGVKTKWCCWFSIGLNLPSAYGARLTDRSLIRPKVYPTDDQCDRILECQMLRWCIITSRLGTGWRLIQKRRNGPYLECKIRMDGYEIRSDYPSVGLGFFQFVWHHWMHVETKTQQLKMILGRRDAFYTRAP